MIKSSWMMKQQSPVGAAKAQYVFFAVLVVFILVHSMYITSLVKSLERSHEQHHHEQQQQYLQQQPQQQPQVIQSIVREDTNAGGKVGNVPEVIIYRRTKKTGSSSMLEQLLHALEGHDYLSLYHERQQLRNVVRGENSKLHPRKLFIATHNAISRNDTAGRRTVIVDTVLDGYKQVTSYCRYGQHVEKCDAELVRCLEGKAALSQRYYRWAGRGAEDASTYIDLPLSAAHPALSTTVFRGVFPNATLDVGRRNSAGSACDEVADVRAAYARLYGDLDAQVDVLRRRLLVLAGYPLLVTKGEISTVEMLDKAEEIERGKYAHKFGGSESTRGVSTGHRELRINERAWAKFDNGEIKLQGAHD